MPKLMRWRTIVPGVALALLSCGSRRSLPSDADLIARFPSVKAHLVGLESAIKADRDGMIKNKQQAEALHADRASIGSRRMVPPPLSPETAGVSAERLEHYRALMNAGGVQLVEEGAGPSDEGCIIFLVAVSGNHLKAQQKGYAHCPTPPRTEINESGVHLRDSLDHVSITVNVRDYRLIEGAWYLHLQGGD